MILDLKYKNSRGIRKILYIIFQLLLLGYSVVVIYPLLNLFFLII